ncbi:MAG: hypothetical protein WCH04_19740 [Gammaproteobacteria bacterium]
MKRRQHLVFTVILVLSWLPAVADESLELEGTTITGNRELPKALHIVPWKTAVPGELAGRPMQSLVDEIMAPVDRDVMRRELEYFDSVHVFEQGASLESSNSNR